MAIEFKVMRNKADEVVGIEITGDGSSEARDYCGTFLSALKKGSGDLTFTEGTVIFVRNNGYPPETYSFHLREDEYEILKKNIHPRNSKLKFEESIAWIGSSRIFVEDD